MINNSLLVDEVIMIQSTRRLKWRIRMICELYFPKFTLWILAQRSWVHEPELAIVPFLASDRQLAVDIGANKGVYLYSMCQNFKSVIGFEPGPALYGYLRRAAPKNAQIFGCALSSQTGTAVLAMPKGFNELATLERQSFDEIDDTETVERFEVETRALDSFKLDGVSLIKIDVEGHEMQVLEGARSTIQRCKPALLIEVEDRHHAGGVDSVDGYLQQLGYQGYFLDDSHVRPMSEFDLAADQASNQIVDAVKVGRYINNFIYLHSSVAQHQHARLTSGIEEARSRTRPH